MDLPHPESPRLTLKDCRRLTGPSLVWDLSGAILDVLIQDIEMDAVLECWYRHIRSVLEMLQCEQRDLTHRRFENGISLLVEAPIDQLYSAVDTLETTWYFCACELLGLEAENRAALLEALRESMQDESNPALLALQQAAAEHQVDFLVDDDYLCVGHGVGSASWEIKELPAPEQVDWASVHDVPVALITGTNGKSTSVRLLDCIARAAQQVSGVTSTDFVRVGDEILDRGDYSGPGGARLLLRDQRLQVAFLEVARGGILRRGLPLKRARAALVTNVARDHLGQYGINTLEALTETKLAVRKALGTEGVLVLNADDTGIVAFMEKVSDFRLCWFSLDRESPQIQKQIAENGRCCYIDGGEIVYSDGSETRRLGQVAEVPVTVDGAAQHNVANVLGVVGVACAMDYSRDHILQGLLDFRSDWRDNPGRMNRFTLKNGAQVIVDFAHNAHGVAAVTKTVRQLPAAKLWTMTGSAGDRSDDEISAIASGVCSLNPDRVVITELDHYLRGRAPGEVSKLMREVCLQHSLKPEQIEIVESPLEGVRFVLPQLGHGDLAMLLVHDDREEIFQMISEY